MQPSAYSTPGTLSGNTGLTFGTGRGAGVGAVDVEASASVAREAVVETLPIVTLEAVSDASSSLSVSPRSKGGLIAGAPSRKSKGSNPVPLPKKCTSRVQSSLQLDPAKATKRCCKAAAFKAAALCSNSVASLNNRNAYKETKKNLGERRQDKMGIHNRYSMGSGIQGTTYS